MKKVTVKVRVAKGPRGRKRLQPAEDVPPAPTPERVPRVARMLALAHHWQGLGVLCKYMGYCCHLPDNLFMVSCTAFWVVRSVCMCSIQLVMLTICVYS